MDELTRSFLAHLPVELRGAPWPLEALSKLYAEGRGSFPSIALAPAPFARQVAAVVESAETLPSLHGADLYLAAACVNRDAEAAALFQRRHGATIDAVVARLGLTAQGDEIRQRLLHALFVGDRRPPFLSTYGGRGTLASWLKVVTLREAYNVARERQHQHKREIHDDSAILERAVHAHDPELEHLRAAYGDHLKRAFEEAFAALEPRDRQLLRFQYLDGLNIEQVGAVFHVSRATAARWRASALERLLAETRRRLAAVLQLSERDCDSVMKLARSQLDLSIARLLGTPSSR